MKSILGSNPTGTALQRLVNREAQANDETRRQGLLVGAGGRVACKLRYKVAGHKTVTREPPQD